MACSWITNNCHDCNLCDASCVQCMPKGSNTPLIYFVGDALNPEETDGVPFTGKSGKYLHDIISPLGLDENNCRFFNIVRCVPRDGDNFRSPNQNEMDTCIKYFLKDVEMTNPRVIVTLGNTPIKALFPDMKGGITKNRGILKKYNNFYVIPTLHPSYLIRQMSNTSVRLDFKKDISLAKKISMDFSVAEAILDSQVLKDSSSSTVLCKSYKEFEEFCANEIDDATDVAYDVETNAEEVHNVNHRIVGFSIASNKDTGCYVPLDSLDFKMDGFDKELIEDKMRDILTTKNIIVYNCQHEYPATLNWLNVEIKSLDDIFVMVKLMMGQAGRYQGNGGLKAQSVMHLGYTDWSEDLDIYFEYVRDYGNKKEEMRNLLSKYYDDENELSNVISLVENAVYNELIGTKKDVISYGYVPYKLVGRYGSIDSSVLFELRKFYYDWMDRDGETLGINLHQGYRYWMWHTYSGYTLERNAAYWNDEYANKVEKWCNEGMVSAIKAMIASPLSESILKEKLYDKFLIYLKDNYIDEIFGKHYTVKKSSKKTVHVICNDRGAEEVLARMSIYPDAKGICKLAIGNVETLAKRFLDSNPNLFEFWFKQYITDFIGSEHTIKEYTELLNPGSTSASFKDFVSKILITPDVRFAKMYTNLVGLIEEPDFNIDAYKDLYDSSVEKVCNYVKRSYNFDITEFLSNNPTVTLIDNVDSKLLTLVDKLKKDPDKSPNEKYKIFLKMATSGRKYYSWKINKAINSSIDYKFECLDAGVMNEIYELYRMLGIDVDDRSTWTEEFTWFYNYKMYKKFAKIISTYIWGATGRANVYYADKESARNDVFTRREDLYDGKDHPDKLMFMQQSFQINMADTGRWKCFTGDTRIKCLDGKSYSFKELVDNGINRLWVYAVNGNGDIIPAIAINPVITKVVNRVLKITLDNGEVIRCTPDHKFMLRDGSYKEARLLTNEDSLMPLYLKETDDGYLSYYCDKTSSYRRVHTMVNETVNSKEKKFIEDSSDKSYNTRQRRLITHHKDFNKKNNVPENLQWMTFKDHWDYHSKLAGSRISDYNTSDKRKNRKDSDKHRESARKTIIKYNLSEKGRNKSREIARKYLNNEEGRKLSSERMSAYNRSEEARERCRQMVLSGKSLYKSEEARERDRISCINRNKNPEMKRKMIIGKGLKICRKLFDSGRDINEENYKSEMKSGSPSYKKILSAFSSYEDLLVAVSNYNHKIKFIEYEDIENCEMYDIEVPEFHNFALDCGVFVHNCGMHNLPAGETIKSIFTSRFKGGCVGMPDGSQMEIRTLAAECKDEGLLKAFEEKLDIHKYFASMIYKVEYDKVEKWQRSLAKNAVFGMIYGESEKTFADSYLNGDLERAREVFDGMFKGFPKIKEYIERAQGQYKKFNRVTTLTQRFINLNDPKADPNRMLRQAQNFPIQAAAEDIAGIILYKLCEFLKENNMKSKPFCFIHDSIEIDMHPDEVFQIVDKINWLFNVFPRQEFGAYVACDVPLGPSMGQEIEIKDMVHDEKYNDVSFILDGYVDDIEQQLNIWREVYDVVECERVEGEEDSEQYQSYSVAFLPKKSSVSMYMGTNRSKGVRKIHVIRKVEQVQ